MLEAIRRAGGKPLLVGGAVRDTLMGLDASLDRDYEVFGISKEDLLTALRKLGQAFEVGKSFTVIKFVPDDDPEHPIDLSLPLSPDMSFEEAASRRDYTINAIGFDPFTKEYIDPFGGIYDIEYARLIATSVEFSRNPIHVLRGLQLSGRFGLTMLPGARTHQQCKALAGEQSSLAPERVFIQWWKWAALSPAPSYGLRFLNLTSWYPELVEFGKHVDHIASRCDQEKIDGEERATMVLAALCCEMSETQCRAFLSKIGCFKSVRRTLNRMELHNVL